MLSERHCMHCGMGMRRKNHYCQKVGYVNSWSVTKERDREGDNE